LSSDRPIRRGHIWSIAWEEADEGWALIVQANVANKLAVYANTIILPVRPALRDHVESHVRVAPSEANGLDAPASVWCEQVFTVPKRMLVRYVGQLEPKAMKLVDEVLLDVISLR
jgi:mRNA-degrading endonuclease toxin of MazEF toxin-antitoxin module